MTKGFRIAAFFGLALAAVLVVFVSSQDTRAAIPFQPGVVFCFEDVNTTAECDGDPSPGVSSDVRNKFCIGWNSDCSAKDAVVVDSNFGGVVAFTPTSVGLPVGNTIPIGALAGRLTAESTLGLIGGSCSTTISVAFTLMNASINISDTISPKPVGGINVMEPLALDADGNGIPDGADKYPAFLNEVFDPGGTPIAPRARLFGISKIQGNWIVLNFDFFEPGTTLEAAGTSITFKPEFGYPSVTILQDPSAPAASGPISDFCAPLLSQNVALGLTKDNPCTGGPAGLINCPSGIAVIANSGYPFFPCEGASNNDDDNDGKINDGCPQVNAVSETGAECDNTRSDDTEDSAVNDGCPPFGDVSEGGRIPGTCSGTDEGGCAFRTNPASAGDIQFSLLVASQRDADSDGIENSLDVCALVANGEWNARIADTVNDPDQDGIPSACDPQPNQVSPGSPQPGPGGEGCQSGYVGPDDDQDCFSNRADNCPTTSQVQNPALNPNSVSNKTIPEDTDSDGIGDACDPNKDVVNGDNVVNCLYITMTVGADASTAPKPATLDANGPACAAAVLVTPSATPIRQTLAPGQSPAGNTGTQTGIGTGPSDGLGTLAPAGTNIPLWAALLAIIGGLGIATGVGIMTTQRVRRRQ